MNASRRCAVLAATATATAVASTTALGATRTVEVGDNYFVRPAGIPTLTVRVGTSVKWRWTGRRPHNVKVASGPVTFASPTRRKGSFTRVLRRKGSYEIVCDIHGARDQQMRLVVR